MPDLTDEQSELMEKELKRTEAIIDSMTRAERLNHMILNANRRRRIARGSGTTVAAGELTNKAVHRNASHDARHVRRWLPSGNARPSGASSSTEATAEHALHHATHFGVLLY